MRARGTTEEDRRGRGGNYSAGSSVMNNTYDYATGLARPRSVEQLGKGAQVERLMITDRTSCRYGRTAI